LIALGILKKEGRRIHGLRNKTIAEEEKQDEFKRVFGENQRKRVNIMEKTKQIKSLRLKSQMIKAIIKRNTMFPTKENRIDFPFIALNLDQNDEVTLDKFRIT
jgi:hypothetical protein